MIGSHMIPLQLQVTKILLGEEVFSVWYLSGLVGKREDALSPFELGTARQDLQCLEEKVVSAAVGVKHFWVSPLPGEILANMFQMGEKNNQLVLWGQKKRNLQQI